MITQIACIDLHQTEFVGKSGDHLQLIKFWPSRAPRKGVCGGAKIFGSALLQPARSVCVSSERFFTLCLSTWIILPHAFKMSAFVTYSCFEWCTSLVQAGVGYDLFNAVLNVYLHN